MTAEDMEKELNRLIDKEGFPTSDEIELLALKWRNYIQETDVIRALKCEKDFSMGMVIMAKRLHNGKEKDHSG